MAKVGDIYAFLDRRAPFAYQESYDNAGFLLGHENKEVAHILVALDLTQQVLEEALVGGVDLIITHHPLIWDKLSAITDRDAQGAKLLRLVEAGIAVISAHTNLDAAEGGVNSVLAAALDLVDARPLHEGGVDADGQPYGIGRVGRRSAGACSMQDFAAQVKQVLQLDGLRMADAGKPVLQVAVGGGACASMLPDVLQSGCDTFVTSEIKHDVYLQAQIMGINLIDAGHYATEAPICAVLANWLREAFPSIDLTCSQTQREVFTYL